MTSRTLTLLAAAALAAAAPAAATAKPHGPDHPGKGHGRGLDRADRADRVDRGERLTGLAESDLAPIAADETPAEKPVKTRGRGRGRSKGKMTVFKGSVVSADASTSTVVVRVRHRNRWARVFRGEEVTFSLETARIQVADTDGDGTQGVADVAIGDRVLVKARVARGAADDGSPIAALRLIDLSSPEEDEDEGGDEDENVVPAPVETEPAPETVPEV